MGWELPYEMQLSPWNSPTILAPNFFFHSAAGSTAKSFGINSVLQVSSNSSSVQVTYAIQAIVCLQFQLPNLVGSELLVQLAMCSDYSRMDFQTKWYPNFGWVNFNKRQHFSRWYIYSSWSGIDVVHYNNLVLPSCTRKC